MMTDIVATGQYSTKDHWICVLPLLPLNATGGDEPPAPAPFDVSLYLSPSSIYDLSFSSYLTSQLDPFLLY
jgi:hypothetical protein